MLVLHKNSTNKMGCLPYELTDPPLLHLLIRSYESRESFPEWVQMHERPNSLLGRKFLLTSLYIQHSFTAGKYLCFLQFGGSELETIY